MRSRKVLRCHRLVKVLIYLLRSVRHKHRGVVGFDILWCPLGGCYQKYWNQLVGNGVHMWDGSWEEQELSQGGVLL